MKTNFLKIVLIAQVMGMALTNCGEASKKDASEEARTAEKANWEIFNAESEIALKNTEIKIKELRDKIAISSQNGQESLIKELDSVEQKHKKLKEKLAERRRKFEENLIEFSEATNEKEHKFRKEFKRDLQEIENALLKIVTPPDNVEDEF